jgi:DNA-binding transcriptional MocR family regulator
MVEPFRIVEPGCEHGTVPGSAAPGRVGAAGRRRKGNTMQQLAERLARLGTETAFAVSLAAAEWAAQGNRVYPFHLGDIDLPTPANIVEAMNRAIADGKTGYCPAAGIAPLRDALAENIGADRGLALTGANIVVQPGGKPVITKFVQALMNPGDGVLYPNPGYPIYESQIDYFGGRAMPYRYHETPTGFGIDLDQLRELAPQARLLVYNDLQNPLGCESTAEERAEIARIAVEHDLWVLSDEAYFEMRYSGSSTSIASLPGHGRADRDPLHVLEEVRDDRLAARVRGGAGRAWPSSSRSSTPTTRAAPPTSCRRRASRRSATRPVPPPSSPSCSSAETQRSPPCAACPG